MTRRRHLRNGLAYGYPLCCVLRFVLGPMGSQAVERGVCERTRKDGTLKVWVPCRRLGHGARPFSERTT